MSSLKVLPVLLAALATSLTVAVDEDFAFDVSDDLEIEFPQESPKIEIKLDDKVASVGQVFQFTVPKNAFGGSVIKYDARLRNGDFLPHWLMFEKSSGTFWGVPLLDDIQTLEISVKGAVPSETKPLIFKLIVEQSKEPFASPLKCNADEYLTVLSLLLDTDIKSIKPRQRVMAINNIAKFFGLPYSAFSLKDSSSERNTDIVSSGSGDVKVRESTLTTSIEVPVGCDGKISHNTAPLIHQLNKLSKDGTISSILKLPLLEWKIEREAVPVIRKRRYIDESGGPVGSGDYDDDYNYDDYEDYEEEPEGEEEGEEVTKLPPSPPFESSTTSTEPVTHPHRHHHGEMRPVEDTEPSIQIIKEPTLAELQPTSPVTEEIIEESSADRTTWKHTSEYVTPKTTTESKQTQPTATPLTPTSSIYTSEEVITEDEEPVTQRTNLYRPIDVPVEEDDDYVEEYDDTEDGEDDEEGITDVPHVQIDEETTVKVTTKAESTSKETTKMETTSKETIKEESAETAMTEDNITNIQTETQYESETTPIYTTVVEEHIVPVKEIPVGIVPTPNTTTTSTESTTPLKSTIVFWDTTVFDNDDDTTTSTKHSTQRHTTMQEAGMPSVPITTTPSILFSQPFTEGVTYEVKNFPPTIQNRLNSIAVTAGKIFEYYIPEDTFSDLEDGHDLTLELLDHEGNPVGKNSWCQFNPRERKIYGLPVEEDVSGWEYILKATDSGGASVSDRLKIRVQHHKSRRVVNHEFSLHLIVEKKYEFPHSVDWALRTLRGLGNLYSLTNLSEITVRKIDPTMEPVVFTWTNDSLPKSYCPRVEIQDLFSILTANDRGDPSKALSLSLAPEIRVKRVTRQFLGICESKPPSPSPPTNYSPILRNPVDHLNAIVGELLVYTVPDDTFYDPEDVEGRNLKMTLLTSDQKPIPPENWLQFDSKNREFYGIPLLSNVGRTQYILLCKDSGGLSATDSLVIVVHAPPRINYNVEFSMVVEVNYESFATSPSMQRKFIEKLRDLFEDHDTSNIHLNSISKGSTIVNWYNKSLPISYCPRDEIKRLEAILVNNDRTISSHVENVMGSEFPVSVIKLLPLGNCRTRHPTVPKQDSSPTPDESSAEESHEEYLITFIVPAVIIATMLLLAGIAACVLYRRRRSGKMNVEEDGRQSYGNKGIPVIFQEELEEKPDPGTKAPVILKDEKPPLAPPEYSKSGSLQLTDDSEPYHPPPPFTRTQDNGKQSRPKPTPTYRKPPPYVPP